MRDILTALAALVILALTAALVVPPFVAWEDHRADLEAALSRAAGAPIETAGAIELRLLPSPRLAVDRLRIGAPVPGAARLDAERAVVELELTPLLRGEARFSSGRAASAEIRLPTGSGDAADIGLPRALGPERGPGAAFTFEDLRADRLAILAAPADGLPRTLFVIDEALVSVQALGGPYRLEGVADGLPFRLVVGSFAPDGTAQTRFVAGFEGPLRIEAEATVALDPAIGEIHPVRLAGEARLVLAGAAGAGPAVADPDRLAIATNFETQPGAVALADLSIESGTPGTGARLEGGGRIDLAAPRLALDLAARRIVVDRLMEGPLGGMIARGAAGGLPIPLALSLAVDAVSVAGEEITDVAADLELSGSAVTVSAARATLPGQARATYAGEVALRPDLRLSGRAELAAPDGARLARFLRRVGAEGPLVAILDGSALDLAADVVLAPDVVALSNLRLAAGEAALTGALRFTPAEAAGRALLEAQIAARGIDVARLPHLPALAAMPQGLDLAITIDAADVRFEGGEGAGRIQASLAWRGDGLVVDTLDITDLAGADVSVSGEIAEDGSGRIEGTLVARSAAPLIALVGGVAFGDATRLIPAFLREGDLDIALTLERLTQADGRAGLRTGINGIAAGGPIDAQWLTVEGRTERVDIALSTDETRTWLDVDHPLVAGRPSLLTMTLGRSGTDRYSGRVVADIAGTRITTTRPLVLDAIDLAPFDGELDLATADLRPLLALLTGRSMAEREAAAEMRASLSRDGADVRLQALGSVAGERFSLDVAAPPGGAPAGTLRTSRLSLPWLAGALVLGDGGPLETGAVWSREAFRPVPPLPFARLGLTIEADRLELAEGLAASQGRLTLSVLRDGIAIDEIDASLADGRIAGTLAIRRPTPETASVVGTIALADLALDIHATRARATGEIAFGGSGGNPAELVGALAGQGRIALSDLVVERADPAGILRGVERALEEEDPLGGRRLQGFVAGALDEGVLAAPSVEAPATLVAGILSLSPLAIEAPTGGGLSGTASLDLRSLRLDLAGFLRSPAAPLGWDGPPPAIGYALRGPLDALVREIDVGPLTNGLAAIVLERELARIEAFEREASERARRLGELRLAELRRARADSWAAEVERRRAEEVARRAAEEAARRDAERLSLEALAQEEARRAAEAEAEAARRLAEEIRRLAEDEARRLAEEEARMQAEAQAQAQAEAEAAARAAEFDREAIRSLLDGATQ